MSDIPKVAIEIDLTEFLVKVLTNVRENPNFSNEQIKKFDEGINMAIHAIRTPTVHVMEGFKDLT